MVRRSVFNFEKTISLSVGRIANLLSVEIANLPGSIGQELAYLFPQALFIDRCASRFQIGPDLGKHVLIARSGQAGRIAFDVMRNSFVVFS
jgi:hypothetical protein